MMKWIGGTTGASFHLGMSDLSAHVAVRVQLTFGSGDGTNRAGRRYFKCVDTNSNFMVWW
jgi:hypothetical protein